MQSIRQQVNQAFQGQDKSPILVQKRSQDEAQIGRWKQVIGDRLQALGFANQTVEAQIASGALNRMTALGRAAYERARLN